MRLASFIATPTPINHPPSPSQLREGRNTKNKMETPKITLNGCQIALKPLKWVSINGSKNDKTAKCPFWGMAKFGYLEGCGNNSALIEFAGRIYNDQTVDGVIAKVEADRLEYVLNQFEEVK